MSSRKQQNTAPAPPLSEESRRVNTKWEVGGGHYSLAGKSTKEAWPVNKTSYTLNII